MIAIFYALVILIDIFNVDLSSFSMNNGIHISW